MVFYTSIENGYLYQYLLYISSELQSLFTIFRHVEGTIRGEENVEKEKWK